MNEKPLPSVLLAVIAAIGVANTYYLQPLLHMVSVSLHLSGGNAGFLVTVTQVGFVIGLALLLPLGDRFDRKALIVISLVCAVVFDIAAGMVSGTISLGVALVGLGLFSVVAQLGVTYAAAAAPLESRSSEIGKVMAGLLAGIVLARAYSGALAQVVGYHGVFLVAAVTTALLAVLTWFKLPRETGKHTVSFRELWWDGIHLYSTEPILRLRSSMGLLSMGAFSIFWATMAFALSSPPYHLNSGIIGLFGLAGLGGILAARTVGHLADRGRSGLTTAMSFSLIALSYVGLYLDRNSLIAFAALTASLDAGIQGAQLSNQSMIYLLAPGAQGRVTMVYMVFYFVGGVLGSSLASILYGLGGWREVTLSGVAAGLAGLIVWTAFRSREALWAAKARREQSSVG